METKNKERYEEIVKNNNGIYYMVEYWRKVDFMEKEKARKYFKSRSESFSWKIEKLGVDTIEEGYFLDREYFKSHRDEFEERGKEYQGPDGKIWYNSEMTDEGLVLVGQAKIAKCPICEIEIDYFLEPGEETISCAQCGEKLSPESDGEYFELKEGN